MALDIVVLPHCDIHVAMAGAPQLELKVYERDYKTDTTLPGNQDKRRYELKDVTDKAVFAFFAPYEPVGSRLTPFVSINATGKVTPLALGINLVQVTYSDSNTKEHYLIVRIQVHATMLGWWFGSPSLTVAKDNGCAHTQVSIYGAFSDDPKRTELVGDITGHGYVNLTSSNNAIFEPDVSRSGRMWGKTPGDGILTGTHLGITKTIAVKVVDYTLPKNILEPVRYTEDYKEAHNMLFIGEGFRDIAGDREKFNEIVAKTVEEIFEKPRHAPYNLLEGSFNVFKAYQPSNQHTITQGCGINDEDHPNLAKGFQVPYDNRVSSSPAGPYTPEELIRRVGLPLRNETRTTAQLKALWSSQSLPNYNDAKVDDILVGVWKKQRSVGIIETRDTFFGLNYGKRYADRRPGSGLIPAPAADTPSAALTSFIGRVYEWFYTSATRSLLPDPRRHPPEIHRANENNPHNIIMQFVRALHYKFDNTLNIGDEWVPDVNGNTFKRSVGMIAVLVNDYMNGGTNMNSLTITAISLDKETTYKFKYHNNGIEKILRPDPPGDIDVDQDEINDTVAHEFGHSFNLGDEYETSSGDDATESDIYDNLANLTSIQLTGQFANRKFDTAKVKWLELLRIELCSKLLVASTTDNGQLKVSIDPQQAGKWLEAKEKNKPVDIRDPAITGEGKQLPLLFDDKHYLVRLEIMKVDETDGFVWLGGLELPSLPLPVFPKGSFIFIPVRNDAGDLQYLVEKKVMDFMTNDATHKNLPLNKDGDHVNAKNGEDKTDEPKSIAGFDPPCKEYKTIGVYEGANYHSGLQYRPAGNCKMREQADENHGGEFCHVCKYLIVNRVDPDMHGPLDREYYPKAKKS
jgi:hypothetical protein